jgi:DNA (cytosine-5)-methyltransferase 1
MDLFAGCGGMSLGLENAGFQVIHANEINKDAAATYQWNFPNVELVVKDIRRINARELKRKLNYPDVDIIAAGPPCQGFSIAGRRRPTDPRNMLFTHVIRFVKEFRPKVVVIENVVGMLRTGKGRVVGKVMKELQRLGYFPHLRVLLASDFGVPQRRERVFIIATSRWITEGELFPKPTGIKVSVAEAISDLAYLGIGDYSDEYLYPPYSTYQKLMRTKATILHNHKSPRHSSKVRKRFASIPWGENGGRMPRKATSKHTYFRMDPMELSRTLTTLPEDFIHYSQCRIPTVREMARLQSFPDDFVFLGPRTTGGRRRKNECPQYTQVGNAVPPLMAEAVFRNLSDALRVHYYDQQGLADNLGTSAIS